MNRDERAERDLFELYRDVFMKEKCVQHYIIVDPDTSQTCREQRNNLYIQINIIEVSI